jgi:hypothetical protein
MPEYFTNAATLCILYTKYVYTSMGTVKFIGRILPNKIYTSYIYFFIFSGHALLAPYTNLLYTHRSIGILISIGPYIFLFYF